MHKEQERKALRLAAPYPLKGDAPAFHEPPRLGGARPDGTASGQTCTRPVYFELVEELMTRSRWVTLDKGRHMARDPSFTNYSRTRPRARPGAQPWAGTGGGLSEQRRVEPRPPPAAEPWCGGPWRGRLRHVSRSRPGGLGCEPAPSRLRSLASPGCCALHLPLPDPHVARPAQHFPRTDQLLAVEHLPHPTLAAPPPATTPDSSTAPPSPDCCTPGDQ